MTDTALQAFLAEHALFQSLVDQSPLMLVVFDTDGGCLYSSRARLVFRGRTLEQERGSGWLESVYPDDQSAISACIRESVADRKPFAVEHRVFRADGVLRWISSQGLPWFSPDREYLGHVAIWVDITDQRQVDAGSREEPRALRRLIENAHDMVYRRRFFPTNSFDYIGGAVLAITGRTAAEFYARPGLSSECVHPDDLHLVATAESPGQIPPVAI